MLQAEAFWSFSLAIYAHKEVERICLAWQDKHGLNVNMLLLCCYLSKLELALCQKDLAQLHIVGEPGEAAIRALRQTRRQAKNRHPETYPVLLKQEQHAEKCQQQLFIDSLNQTPLQSASADNLGLYLEYKQIKLTPELLKNKDTLNQTAARLQV